MSRGKREHKDRGYANKRHGGCEVNHERHPKSGIPWCEKCIKEGRA